jgi:hypothetical protein
MIRTPAILTGVLSDFSQPLHANARAVPQLNNSRFLSDSVHFFIPTIYRYVLWILAVVHDTRKVNVCKANMNAGPG